VDAHANSIKVYQYLKNVLNMNSYNEQGGNLSATTNFLFPRFPLSYCGSKSDAGSWFNAFSMGNKIYYTPAKPEQDHPKSLSSIINVAAHEWGHSITNNFSKLTYSRESGALNEAFSDWLGIAIEQYYTTKVKSWIIGFENQPFRSMQNPSSISGKYAPHHNYKILKNGIIYQPIVGEKIPFPDTYKGNNWHIADESECPNPSSCENDYCGVHHNSSVGNKMFYLLSVGGTHNGITVTGIGVDNAMKIALDANKNQWSQATTFHDAKAGMIASAGSDKINGVDIAKQVKLAWEAVNVLNSNRSD
jgi:Zn-dependent metalloprotease